MLEYQSDDLNEGPSVLVHALVHPMDDLFGNQVESLHRKLVEQRLDLAVDQFR